MIITLGRDSWYRYTYILCVDTVPDKKTFLDRAKVRPGSYAGELINGVYDAIFVCALDLKRDFTEYYSIEYSDFAEYLRKRQRIRGDVVPKISRQYEKVATIIQFQPRYDFLEDDYGIEFLQKLIEPEKTK
jgi:hypothetical protein